MAEYDEHDYEKYRERYGPELKEHFDLSLKAWREHAEIREAFPGFTTWNQSIREPERSARRAEAHALIREYTDYVIDTDDKGLPVLRPGVVAESSSTKTSGMVPVVEARWEEPKGAGPTQTAGQPTAGTARSAKRSAAFVRCPACREEFAVPPKALKKLMITSGSALTGAAIGAGIGAAYGTGVGIASGGTAAVGTVPLGVAGGVVGGAVFALGGKLGADFALTKVTCPRQGCGQAFRVRGGRRP